ncbi:MULTISPECIES: Maf family protein [Cysteiniphilum]|uniref:Septum formation inhibitor Maf n=1 Tax=Cysteiniphilum litorale TaxID=2056700 RepID=A0A8J2Z298_9GAMM|nr:MULTISPECIES: Maf family protein [Cysteiniphilum]GGF88986.1 hypothetical protein GCM10010995_02830 [Cysteiniphilum litorale]
MPKRFILASSSPYRINLIKTLLPNVEAYTPDIDESILQGEPPQALVKRLAQAKAQAIIERVKPKNTIIIASDQVGVSMTKSSPKHIQKIVPLANFNLSPDSVLNL